MTDATIIETSQGLINCIVEGAGGEDIGDYSFGVVRGGAGAADLPVVREVIPVEVEQGKGVFAPGESTNANLAGFVAHRVIGINGLGNTPHDVLAATATGLATHIVNTYGGSNG